MWSTIQTDEGRHRNQQDVSPQTFRDKVMMFVISLATMLSDTITHVLKTKGIDTTMQGIFSTTSALDVLRDADGEYLDGSWEHIELLVRVLESLQVDLNHLLGDETRPRIM